MGSTRAVRSRMGEQGAEDMREQGAGARSYQLLLQAEAGTHKGGGQVSRKSLLGGGQMSRKSLLGGGQVSRKSLLWAVQGLLVGGLALLAGHALQVGCQHKC